MKVLEEDPGGDGMNGPFSTGGGDGRFNESSAGLFDDADLALSMLIPTIDPVQWKEETERVASLLIQARRAKAVAGDMWGDHLGTMKDFARRWGSREEGGEVLGQANIAAAFPSSSSSSSQARANAAVKNGVKGVLSDGDWGDAQDLYYGLGATSRELRELVGKITRGEQLLNKNGNFNSMGSEFGIHQKVLGIGGKS